EKALVSPPWRGVSFLRASLVARGLFGRAQCCRHALRAEWKAPPAPFPLRFPLRSICIHFSLAEPHHFGGGRKARSLENVPLAWGAEFVTEPGVRPEVQTVSAAEP